MNDTKIEHHNCEKILECNSDIIIFKKYEEWKMQIEDRGDWVVIKYCPLCGIKLGDK